MNPQFIPVEALQQLQFQVSLLRIMSPGDAPVRQAEQLGELATMNRPAPVKNH
jgi:hypothetical protein